MTFRTQFYHGFGLGIEATEYVNLGKVETAEDLEDVPTSPLWILTVGCFRLFMAF